jgi:hypothetical protein
VKDLSHYRDYGVFRWSKLFFPVLVKPTKTKIIFGGQKILLKIILFLVVKI